VATAQAPVAAPVPVLYAFLVDLERHWELVPDLVEVVSARRDGAVLRLRGPLGLRRTVRTRVTGARAPHELTGRAETAGGSLATVGWTLAPRADHTHVSLSADVERVAPLDRLLLALGGRRWLDRALARAVSRLEALVARPALDRAA
jgi:Polyketide cyclase / dehydrase and lipid transport